MTTTRSIDKITMENADLAKMVRAILREEIADAFKTNLKPINEALSDLKGKVSFCVKKVEALEDAANCTDSKLTAIEKDNKELQTEISKLKKKTEALENHSRKFNLRIIGLPNGIEAGRPTEYVTKLIYDIFGKDALGPPPLINVAHRIGSVEKEQGRNRCMIVRVHSFEVRQTILRRASERGKEGIHYQGKRLSIYPDTTAEQREQQAAFDEVRRALRKTKLRYGIVYPTKMLITMDNTTYSFTEASKAMDFYKKKIEPTLNTEDS